MAKISINIKSGTVEKTNEKKPLVFGIDLGTTNSLIAFINESGNSEVIRDEDAHAIVPSVIHFGKEELHVGFNAKQYLTTDPTNTVYSVKRLMGKSFDDVRNVHRHFSYKIIDEDTEKLVKIKAGEKFYTPVELSAMILTELKQRAEKLLDTEVKKVVITVPAYFNDTQRQATRNAGKLAGLEVLRIVNEPTAASLAYGIGLKKDEEKTVAVYDLGGGTFDISILKIADGVFEVLSTNGNTFLGGDDIDAAIEKYWIAENHVSENEILADEKLNQQLRLKAEEAKIFLSSNNQFQSKVGSLVCTLSEEKLKALSTNIVNQTLQCCKQAMHDAKISYADLDEILLVGGSTRMPLIRNAVENFFGKKPNHSLNPDEVVALGAAIQGDVLAGNQKDILLLDVTPLSLGIETIGELMDVLIPRNSKIPNQASRTYTTSVDGQTKLKISIYQGERDLVKHNRRLAEFVLNNIPPMPAGFPKIEIRFTINADGILNVKATELRSNTEQSIEVKPQFGLTDAQVESMLLESITYAKEDMALRSLVESRTEAQQVLQAAEKFIKLNKKIITEHELQGMEHRMNELKNAMDHADKNAIQNAMDELNTFSAPFAHRAMDEAIAGAIKGKQI